MATKTKRPDLRLRSVRPGGEHGLGERGINHDTAEFAVATIRRWWKWMGQPRHPQARRLLIMADAGGSNGARLRLWKPELRKLADELRRLPLSAGH